MKYLVTLAGIVLLFSFAPMFRKEARHSIAPVQKATGGSSDDTLSAIAIVDSAYLFKLLKRDPDELYVFMKDIDGDFGKLVSEDGTGLQLKWHHNDFYGDPTKEIILHFRNEEAPLDLIYILTKAGRGYHVSEPLKAGYEGAYDDKPPVIDYENHCVLVKSRMWGTCTGGYAWDVHRFGNGKFKHVLSFVGEHGYSTCGAQDPEEAWQIASRHAFYDPDAILFTGILVHETFRYDDAGEVVHLGKELVNVEMRYRYDPVRDTFQLYNNEGVPLTSNPVWANEFWEMHEKKEL